MGVDFAIEFEPDDGAVAPIGEDKLTAYYRTHCASGVPPLAEIREHVARALAAERAVAIRDPITPLHAEFVDRFGRDKIWWASLAQSAAPDCGI